MDYSVTEQPVKNGISKVNSRHDKAMELLKEKEDFVLSQIKAYKLNMFRVANSILSNSSDAEDAVSECILKAYKSILSLKNVDSFKPWVMKILVRECYKILKQRAKVDYYTVPPEIAVKDFDNTSQILWSFVNLLPNEFRCVVVLFYYEDMSIKTIAETLSLPQGTVKSRLSRGKEKLKQIIEGNGGLDFDKF